MLMTEFALAPAIGEQYRERRAFPLATGGAGFLASDGARAVARLSQVSRIEVPSKLRDLCVAPNGKTTIATTQESGEVARLWIADSFDGSMRPLGFYLGEIRRQGDDGLPRPRSAWVVHDEKATSLVDCESGKVEPLAPPVAWARESFWSDAVQILELRTEKPASTYCLLRTTESPSWSKHPDCYVRPRGDGSVAVETLSRQQRAQPKCAFVLDEHGKKTRCDAPINPTKQGAMPVTSRQGDSLRLARYYASSKAVTPGPDGGLFLVGPDGRIDPTRRVGPPSLQTCTPLLPTLPVYRCVLEGKFDAVVNVDVSGQVRQELKRPKPAKHDDVARAEEFDAAFHVTSDGGIAVGGDCSGNLGNVACVRSANGVWHEVPFSKELTTALSRTAPATRLVPTPEGQLFVGTGTAEGLLGGGNVQVLVFRADQGPGKVVEKIPAWILGSLSGMGGLGALLGSSGGPAVGPSLAWSTSKRVRIWPLERQHPAFHTKEFCRVDIALDGTFDTECVQGRVFAVGRLGLWEKRVGELYETLDAGQSWTPVELPKGAEADDVVCAALGCRIGPYWRAGWGAGSK